MRLALTWWLQSVLPRLAALFFKDVQPYRYLAASIMVRGRPMP